MSVWQRLLDACPAAACLVRVGDGTILAMNQRCRIVAGCPLDEGLESGLRLELWTTSESSKAIRESVVGKRLREPFLAQFRVAPDSPVREVNATLAVVTGAEGEELLMVFLQRADEVREVEQALAAARDAAIESARLKSEFLANISHEIRTPLNGIIGMTQLLRDTKLSSLQRNFTETIRLSADNLLHMINEILDFSKLEAGKLIVDYAPFDLQSAVEGTLDLLAERAHSKGLELTYMIRDDVPTHLLGDANRLRQILTNLLGNAIKFTEQGEVSLEISAEPADDGAAALRFEIADTGIGIPESALPRLFQMFHQVDSSTSRRFGGTGLGLAICRQLVEVMRGTIGVASTPGQGSRFWFRLPFDRQSGRTPAPADIPARLQGLRVLLLEANATNARNLKLLLERLHIHCEHVLDGREALAALRTSAREERPLRVAILDMASPGMDGLSLARAIKVDSSIADTRILLLTTITQQVETSLLHATNVGACLVKPLKQSRMVDYLVAALSDQSKSPPAKQRALEQTDPIEELALPSSAVPLRIMIAEDNPINQKVARGLLHRFGYATELVDSGRKVLRAAELSTYDIIFMDCQLPEMDGLQATRELRKRETTNRTGRRTYIIAMTADAVPGARERCIEAGMDDYLSKPIRLNELHGVLRRAMEYVQLDTAREQRINHAVIDPQVIETLRLLRVPGQVDPLPPLIEEFVATAQARIEEIQGATMNRDTETVEFAAHSLRGSAAGIGAMRLSSLAGELEDGVKNGSLNRVNELLSRIESEFLNVRRALDFEKDR